MSRFSPRERLESIVAGEKPDRFAASFWRHFFHMEHHAEGTAEAMLGFQKRFEWDFMKINPRADYHIEDWGLKQKFSHDEFKKHEKSNFPISKPEDWQSLKALETTAPVLAEHLKAVSLIKKGSDDQLPLLMTVFTPLAIAGRMVEDDQTLVDHIRNQPEMVQQGLEIITATFERFVADLRNAGADGIFFATTQWASSNLITWQEYERFGMPYDKRILDATESDALNLFHVCSSNNFLEELSRLDYTPSLINWDSNDPTNLPLDTAMEKLGSFTPVGGVDHQGWLLQSKPDEVAFRIKELIKPYNSSQFIIAPGCSIPPETPMENLQAVKESL